MTRRLIAKAIGLAIAGLLVAALAACSGGDKGDEVATASGNKAAGTPSASASVDSGDQLRLAAQCLRDHGIDIPDPDPNAAGGGAALRALANADRTKLAAALEACRDKLPNGGQPPKLDPGQLDQLRLFTQCMREHKVDIPDPDPNQIGFGLLSGSKIDINDPTFQAAFLACRDKLPNFRATPSPAAS